MNNRRDNALNKIDKAVDRLSISAATISIIVILFMVLMVTVYVVVRFAGGQWTFVEEWVGYLLVLMTFFGCAYALRSDGHVSVTVVIRLVPTKVRLWMAAITSLLALVVLVFFVERSISWLSYTWIEETVSSFTTHTPMWIPSMFVTTGMVIFTIAMAMHLVHRVISAVRGIEEEEAKIPIQAEID